MERKLSRRVFITSACALGLTVLSNRLIKGLAMQENQGGLLSVEATPTLLATPEVFKVEKIDWPEATVTPVSAVIPIWPAQEEVEIHDQKKVFLLNLVKLPTPTMTPTLTPIPTLTPKPTPVETITNLASAFIWRGNINKPNVALTFDDGWWAEWISKILRDLEDTKTRLTFFVAGQAIEPYAKLWRELVNIGCKIECHSYTHRFDVAKLSVEDILDEIDRSQAVLDRVLDRHEPFSFYRPAGGAMSDNIVKALKLRNLRGVIWTLSGQGTSPIATAETVTQRILSLAGNGYITLHHFSKNDADALKPIILGLRAKGLIPSRLDETV